MDVRSVEVKTKDGKKVDGELSIDDKKEWVRFKPTQFTGDEMEIHIRADVKDLEGVKSNIDNEADIVTNGDKTIHTDKVTLTPPKASDIEESKEDKEPSKEKQESKVPSEENQLPLAKTGNEGAVSNHWFYKLMNSIFHYGK